MKRPTSCIIQFSGFFFAALLIRYKTKTVSWQQTFAEHFVKQWRVVTLLSPLQICL